MKPFSMRHYFHEKSNIINVICMGILIWIFHLQWFKFDLLLTIISLYYTLQLKYQYFCSHYNNGNEILGILMIKNCGWNDLEKVILMII